MDQGVVLGLLFTLANGISLKELILLRGTREHGGEGRWRVGCEGGTVGEVCGGYRA